MGKTDDMNASEVDPINALDELGHLGPWLNQHDWWWRFDLAGTGRGHPHV